MLLSADYRDSTLGIYKECIKTYLYKEVVQLRSPY